ncbi:MAG: hypothetical protein AB7I30_05890 [Isosphaeraceae bacterium]
MRHLPHFFQGAALGLVLLTGCGPSMPEGNPLEDPTAVSTSDPAGAEFNAKISDLMNDVSARYRALEYEFNEDLLAILDRVEARLSGKLEKLDPLPMPKLDEAEQLDHFREVIKRWSEKTGKSLRAELDPLLAEVAARKPTGGPAFHPEFQKKFAAVFDDFIPIEVAEARERRNKALHEAARPLLEEYRTKAPDAVKRAEATLDAPPYDLPKPPA